MEFGTHLVAALVAGAFFWLVGWICGRLAAPSWLSTILSGAALVYVFWLLLTFGPIQVGR